MLQAPAWLIPDFLFQNKALRDTVDVIQDDIKLAINVRTRQ